MEYQKLRDCIDACMECAIACEYSSSLCSATLCFDEYDVKVMTKCIQLDQYCANICRSVAAMLAMTDSDYMEPCLRETCLLCAIICEGCEKEFLKHRTSHLRSCAEACRVCADNCRSMAMAA